MSESYSSCVKYMYAISQYIIVVVSRRDVLTAVVKLHNYEDMFLPDALRKFFSLIPAPNERGQFLENLLNLFSQQYLVCNPDLQMSTGKQASVVSCSKCVLITGAPLYSPSTARHGVCDLLLTHSPECGSD